MQKKAAVFTFTVSCLALILLTPTHDKYEGVTFLQPFTLPSLLYLKKYQPEFASREYNKENPKYLHGDLCSSLIAMLCPKWS